MLEKRPVTKMLDGIWPQDMSLYLVLV